MPNQLAILMLLLSCLLISSCTEAPKEATIKSSGIIQENFDKSILPQDNFYRFVNGHWLKKAKVPSDKSSIGTFYDVHDDAQNNINKIVSGLIKVDSQSMSEEELLVANFYHAYVNTEKRNSLGISPIQPLLEDIQALRDKSELGRIFGKLQRIGIASPAVAYVSADAKKPNINALHLWQSGISLPAPKYYTEDNKYFQKIRAEFESHIIEVIKLAGIKDGQKLARQVINIESELAKIQWSGNALKDSEKRYSPLTINALKQLTPSFNWQDFFQAQGISEQDKIIVNQLSYIEQLQPVIEQFSLEQWQSYLTFHTLNRLASFLTTELAQQNHKFYKTQLNGVKDRKPIETRGVAVVNRYFPDVLGRLYVAKHFDPKAKIQMEDLVAELVEAYSQLVNEADWLSEETKKQALAKIRNINKKIGYPSHWQDYSSLDIKHDDLIGNVIRTRKFQHAIEIDKINQPVNKEEWIMPPQSVNAYYNPTANEIAFPAAILQSPFFSVSTDDAINFGGIGTVIGHELAHVLDKQGGKFDANGKLRNWWTKKDLNKFSKRTNKLVQQYGAFELAEGVNLNGENTLDENAGDLVGIEIAYRALQNRLKKSAMAIQDGYSPEQRFFIGFAQIWRYKSAKKENAQLTMTSYSPPEFRVLGALANTDAFYQAFAVEPHHNMYLLPEKRVKIWSK